MGGLKRRLVREASRWGVTRGGYATGTVKPGSSVRGGMAVSVHQMLAFSDAMNEKWFPWLREQPTDILDRDLKFSFYTPLGILTHLGNVEATWIGFIEGEGLDWRNPPYSTKELHEAAPVLEFLKETRARTHEIVDDRTEEELQEVLRLEDASWLVKDELTVEELVWIVFTHEQWHRGELLAAFWSQGVKPPRVDWHQYDTPIGGILP